MLLLISVLLKINFPIVIAESLYVLANFISSSKLSLILFGSSSKNNSNLLSRKLKFNIELCLVLMLFNASTLFLCLL